jgi:hypothetical protein
VLLKVQWPGAVFAGRVGRFKVREPDEYVGLHEDVATDLAHDDGYETVRITRRDGNAFVVTRDYRTDRINFNIEQHLVVAASVG